MTFIRFIDLPLSVRGFTVQDDDLNYNVYVNSKYCHSQQMLTIGHEMQHIQNGDFFKSIPAHLIERGQ